MAKERLRYYLYLEIHNTWDERTSFTVNLQINTSSKKKNEGDH